MDGQKIPPGSKDQKIYMPMFVEGVEISRGATEIGTQPR